MYHENETDSPTPEEFSQAPGDARTCRLRTHSSEEQADNPSVSLGQAGPVPSKEDTFADISAALTAANNSNSSSEKPPATTFPVLVRATNGKSGDDRKAGHRVKLATVVDSDALDAFYARYAEVCKAGMLALKPRDRSKRKTKGKKKKGAAAS